MWSLPDADPGTVVIVLRVPREVVKRTEGRIVSFSRRDARLLPIFFRAIEENYEKVPALADWHAFTAGEELAVISKVLGHADYSTTLRVYAHLDPARAKLAAARIDAVLGRMLPAIDEAANA